MNIEDLTKKVEDLEKRAAEKQAAKKEEERKNDFYKNNFKGNNMDKKENRAWADIAKAMIEQRSISIIGSKVNPASPDAFDNGIGAINQVADLWDLIKQKEPLLDRISYFNGPNFETQIPVLEAKPAVPTSYAETASKSGAIDSTAAVKVKRINPETYFTVLPITYEAARQSFVGLEDRIPGLLAEAFRTAMCKLVFDSIFDEDNIASDNVVTTATNAGVTLADLENLALKVKDYDVAEPVIVMNPGIYGAIASASANGYDFLKEELVRNKSIEGIPVILSGKAPAFTAELEEGKIVVWAGDLKNFAMGVADQVTVEPLKKVGDSNIYYQAIAAFNGTVVQPKNVFGLGKAGV